MGLILDSSILIADERGKFDMAGFLRQFPVQQPVITAVTACELLHGSNEHRIQRERLGVNCMSNRSWPP